jgi:hypothetical protein
MNAPEISQLQNKLNSLYNTYTQLNNQLNKLLPPPPQLNALASL